MQLLTEYFEIEEKIHKYFGYKEGWVAIPIDDSRRYYWRLADERGGEVQFADTEEELENQDGNYYINEIYKQRFLPKWVYRGDEYTMVVVDTRTDGNKFLQIFDNSKERP